MIARSLPLLKWGSNQVFKGLRLPSTIKTLTSNAEALATPTLSFSSIYLKQMLVNYQLPALTLVRRLFEENSAESILERAILNVNTFRRKKTKLKKSKRKQKRKKLRRLSDRKRRKLNLIK
jgi:hypothetical protein